MALNKLRRTFEERRLHLIEKLDKNRSELDLSQQHQIYGAIKEIEQFLKSIDHHRTLEADSAFDIELSQEKEWPFARRLQRIIRKLGNGSKEVIVWTFWRAPVRLGRGVRGSMEEYRERRQIEKQVRAEVLERMKKQ
jgi:hypothetical protein